MNTNPTAKTVLCYGDSNVNGAKPDRNGRYTATERWTGILQKKLGDDYYIIEEGLGGRTTDLDHYNPDKPNRNGLPYFKACVDSHMTMDIIIILLGTNDLKTIYDRSVEDIANALKQYPEYIHKYCHDRNITLAQIVLVSPTPIDINAPEFLASMPRPGIYDERSAAKSRQFAVPFRSIADETGCVFFDAAKVARAGQDGIHFDLQSHKNFADSMFTIINDLSSKK